MSLGRFVKAPAERKRYSVSYENWLDSGETISAVGFGVAPETESPLAADAYSIGDGGTKVLYYVSDGLAGQTYTLTITVTTSGGQVKEDIVVYAVRGD